MMVDIQCSANQCQYCFVLRPNRSMSWRGTLVFFFSLLLLSGCIAVGLTVLGFWLVLPFAGLEMLALGSGLYVVACRCYECEVISISDDSIRIEKGRRYPRQRWIVGAGLGIRGFGTLSQGMVS